jgi:hypothetical protein
VKSSTFCYITPYSPVNVNRRFGVNISGPKSKPSKKPTLNRQQVVSFFGVHLGPEDGGDIFHRKIG